MAVHRLTDRWLASCPPPPRGRLEFADGLCPCLRARITSKGTRSFSVVRWVDGRQQRVTIGQYPALSLAEARARAKEVLLGAAARIDPPAPDASDEIPMTYAEMANMYVERHLKPNTRSWRNIKSSLLDHPAVQRLLAKAAANITRRELVEVVDSIAAAGAPQAAVNVLRRLKMLFNWAVDRDLLPANPCERIRPPARTVERDRVLTEAEIASVWKASHGLPTPYGQMYRMFLLTGQRRSEVATMRWAEVEGDLWTIPREKVKKDRPHTVPLTAAAQEVLSGLAKLPRVVDDNGFVFTTTGGKSASSNFAKVKRELDALSGVTGWTIHDIRRTVRSKLAELGVPREVARKVLNHEDGKVDRIYNRHEYLAEKREALEKWEGGLSPIVLGDRKQMGKRKPRITGEDWEPAPLPHKVSPFCGDGAAVLGLSLRYDLLPDDRLLKLISNLRERGSRERAEHWSSKEFKNSRLQSKEALEVIIGLAGIAHTTLVELSRFISEFEEKHQYDPNLMQEIAAVGAGTDFYAAEELQCLSSVANLINPGGELMGQLGTLTKVSIKPKRTRARIPNMPVQKCAAEIRQYWEEQGHTWKPEALEDKQVRDDNDPYVLVGDAERFACDVLRLAGINHTLSELSAVMGKRARKAKSATAKRARQGS